MAIYYASIGYTSTPETQQIIPAGGNHPLKFPRDEQTDPWEMHPKRRPDGYVVGDFLLDPESAVILPPVDGMASIQVDVVWDTGRYIRRTYVISENWPYENTFHYDTDPTSWTSMAFVRRGEPFAVLVGHDSLNPQGIVSARIQVAIQSDIAQPPVRRARERRTPPAEPLRRR